MNATELDPAEFEEYDDEGYRYLALPQGLVVDETKCATEGCDNFVGLNLDTWEDGYGYERCSLAWSPTYKTDDGRYICEDCAHE